MCSKWEAEKWKWQLHKLHRDKAGTERQVTGRTGRFLRMENAERRKEEETDDAKGGGDTYRSKVLEQMGGNSIQTKNGGVASESSRDLPFTERGRRLTVGADKGRLVDFCVGK